MDTGLYYLLLGSNKGDREAVMARALDMLRDAGCAVQRCSSRYASAPWGFQSEDDFLNMAVEVRSSLSPVGLLDVILEVESALGRVRSLGTGYESRTIDIDILHWDGGEVAFERLQVPHRLIHLRRFALMPMAEIAGEAVHPVLRKTFAQLLAECPDASPVHELQWA